MIPVDEATLRGLRNAGVQGSAAAAQKTAAEIVAALDTDKPGRGEAQRRRDNG